MNDLNSLFSCWQLDLVSMVTISNCICSSLCLNGVDHKVVNTVSRLLDLPSPSPDMRPQSSSGDRSTYLRYLHLALKSGGEGKAVIRGEGMRWPFDLTGSIQLVRQAESDKFVRSSFAQSNFLHMVKKDEDRCVFHPIWPSFSIALFSLLLLRTSPSSQILASTTVSEDATDER